MSTQTPWARRHQHQVRLSDEGEERLRLLAESSSASKAEVVDLLLRALPLAELKELVRSRRKRDEDAESAWSRSG
jgi:hypothetical protein